MDQKILLVEIITLLFRESQLDTSKTGNSAAFVKPLVEEVVVPEGTLGSIDYERDMFVALKQLCFEMIEKPETHQYVAVELLQKVRHAAREDDVLYDAFRLAVEGTLEETELKTLCINIRNSIRNYYNEKKIDKILGDAAYLIRFQKQKIVSEYGGLKNFLIHIDTELEPYRAASTGEERHASIVDSIDLDDLDALEKSYEQAQELNDDKGIMMTGWQGLNRMLQGGLRRGEQVVIPALQHNFKTGFTLSLFRHIAMFNTPYMLDPTKKPMLLRITHEDSFALNMPFLYRNIYENETKQIGDVLLTPAKVMAKYVLDKMGANGFTIRMLHIDPTSWTIHDLKNLILQIEAEGYEIHLCMIDYLALMSKQGLAQGPTGSDIRDLFRQSRNFFSKKKITQITPHQLSTEAKKLIRDGFEEEFLEAVEGKGYYDSCRTIDQEVDLEIYIHKVIVDGKSWLMVRRGKHRLMKQTKREYLQCVLPFEDIGDIRDDVHGPDTTRKRPGGNPINSKGGEAAFWQYTNDEAMV